MLSGFTGEILHSSEYLTAAQMDGKHVLVIGSSVSGTDIVCSLAKHGTAASITCSVQRVRYAVDKFTKDGRSTEIVFFNCLPVYLSRVMPDALNAKGFKSSILANFPAQVTTELSQNPSLVPDPDVNEASVVITDYFVERLREKHFALKPGVAAVKDRVVTFDDGTSREFDIVVTATGYRMDRPSSNKRFGTRSRSPARSPGSRSWPCTSSPFTPTSPISGSSG